MWRNFDSEKAQKTFAKNRAHFLAQQRPIKRNSVFSKFLMDNKELDKKRLTKYVEFKNSWWKENGVDTIDVAKVGQGTQNIKKQNSTKIRN